MRKFLQRRDRFRASKATIFSIGAVSSIVVIVGDRSPGPTQVFTQATAWTIIAFGLLLATLWPFLHSWIERVLLLLLFLGHLTVLFTVRTALPLQQAFRVFVYASLEAVVLGLIFVKLSQSVNATSPFRKS